MLICNAFKGGFSTACWLSQRVIEKPTDEVCGVKLTRSERPVFYITMQLRNVNSVIR